METHGILFSFSVGSMLSKLIIDKLVDMKQELKLIPEMDQL